MSSGAGGWGVWTSSSVRSSSCVARRAADSTAAVMSAASSAGNTTESRTIPSPAGRLTNRRFGKAWIRVPASDRYVATVRASCDAVISNARSHNSSSSTRPTNRVSSRTFETTTGPRAATPSRAASRAAPAPPARAPQPRRPPSSRPKRCSALST